MTVQHILTGTALVALGIAVVLVYQRSDNTGGQASTPETAPVSTPIQIAASIERRPAPPASKSPAPSAPKSERPHARDWDSAFVELVSKKYRYLLADVRSSADRAKLLQLLLERESSAAALPQSRERVAEIEREMQAMLPAAHFTTFELLRESDNEQHHLSEYAGGVSGMAPLTTGQKRAVLEAKLRHKRAYEAVLRDTGLDLDRLSFAEREYAHSIVKQAIRDYRNGFLLEVQPLLTQEQYTLLSNYENTEFERELRKMQIAINAK